MRAKATGLSALVFALTGCIGYGPSRGEHLPGYSESRRSDGAYFVRYNAPARSTGDALLRAIERRARELCPEEHRIGGFERDTVALMHSERLEYDTATAVVRCGH